MNIITKANFILQHHPVEMTLDGARAMDKCILTGFARVFRLSPSELASSERQIRLPTKKGGFGLTSLEDNAILLRLAALTRTVIPTRKNVLAIFGETAPRTVFTELPALVDQAKALVGLAADDTLHADLQLLLHINEGSLSSLSDAQVKTILSIKDRLRQRYNDSKVKAWRDTFSNSSPLIHEKLESICTPEAGRFLNVTTTFHRHHIPEGPFLLAVKRRLMLRVVPLGTPPCEMTGDSIDELGEHFLACKKLGRGPGHHEVKDAAVVVLNRIGKLARFKVRNEPDIITYAKNAEAQATAGVDANADETRARADIGLYDINNRTTVLIDVRTCTMIAPKAKNEAGQTVRLGEKAKEDAYTEKFNFPSGVTLIPFAIDSHGRWGVKFAAKLKSLCRSAAGNNMGLYNTLISEARAQISVVHMKAVGHRILGAINGNKCITNEAIQARLATLDYGLVT